MSGVQIFPNPVSDDLKILHHNGLIKEIQVYDAVGKLITRRIDMSNSILIKTTHWSKGLYIVLVEDENGYNEPFKIIKQ